MQRILCSVVQKLFWTVLVCGLFAGTGLFVTAKETRAQQESYLNDLHRKAEHGDPEAQFALGRYYQDRHGNPKFASPKAMEWYRKAAEQGHAEAQYRVGKRYATEGYGVFSDALMVAEWYRKAAEQGHARAQLALGWLYKTGHGVPKDENRAMELFFKAAEQDAEVKNALEDLQQDVRRIWLKFLAFFAIMAIVLMVVAEVFSWLLRRVACLARPFTRLLGFVLACVSMCIMLFLYLSGNELVLGPVVSSVYDEIWFVGLAGWFLCALPAFVLFNYRSVGKSSISM